VAFSLSLARDVTLVEARVALVSWLLAKKHGGTLVLRLEELDAGIGAHEPLPSYEDLQWLGIGVDEGPAVGGEFGPYCQAERSEIYKRYLEKLLTEQSAFRCFCVANWAASGRSVPDHCTAECFRLSARRVAELVAGGAPFLVRLKGQAGEIVLHDMIRWRISLRGEVGGDVVLASPSGTPSAPFRAAVDDALMMISHVVREETALLFTLRQLLICRALELEPPQVAHVAAVRTAPAPEVVAEQPPLTLARLRREGYLPSTVLRFLARLAGMQVNGASVQSAAELIPLFRIQDLSTYEAVLDQQVLRDESQRQLRLLREEELREALRPYLARVGIADNDPRLPQVLSLYRDWAWTLADLAQKILVVCDDAVPVIDKAAVEYLARESSQKVLWSVVRQLRSLSRLDAQLFSKLMAGVRQETGVMGHDLWTPVRVALTGERDGPPLPQVVALLGKERCQKLLERSLG